MPAGVEKQTHRNKAAEKQTHRNKAAEKQTHRNKAAEKQTHRNMHSAAGTQVQSCKLLLQRPQNLTTSSKTKPGAFKSSVKLQ
jgi:hypothetical protein